MCTISCFLVQAPVFAQSQEVLGCLTSGTHKAHTSSAPRCTQHALYIFTVALFTYCSNCCDVFTYVCSLSMYCRMQPLHRASNGHNALQSKIAMLMCECAWEQYGVGSATLRVHVTSWFNLSEAVPAHTYAPSHREEPKCTCTRQNRAGVRKGEHCIRIWACKILTRMLRVAPVHANRTTWLPQFPACAFEQNTAAFSICGDFSNHTKLSLIKSIIHYGFSQFQITETYIVGQRHCMSVPCCICDLKKMLMLSTARQISFKRTESYLTPPIKSRNSGTEIQKEKANEGQWWHGARRWFVNKGANGRNQENTALGTETQNMVELLNRHFCLP